MLQGMFQGWNEKTNLFVCGYTSALGKRKLFFQVICPLNMWQFKLLSVKQNVKRPFLRLYSASLQRYQE